MPRTAEVVRVPVEAGQFYVIRHLLAEGRRVRVKVTKIGPSAYAKESVRTDDEVTFTFDPAADHPKAGLESRCTLAAFRQLYDLVP